ncbi:hypothetical protein CK203_030193 [Vitis vinifera]|uniref:DUF4220 domain-containing protein n=1 Tax=Vitis vinifera TaxID=29760 RepID=A0A438I5L6_VITVI|nr:hypothetical protein CK203_030193 [Vitis vinifera]
MIIMNRRIVQEILPVIVIGFLNDWLLRVFILVSLFSQIELLLLGNRRKYTPGNWLRSIIWQAYTTKDAIIDISIGVLFTCQGASEDNSSQQNDMIKAFWLAFLLLHLGGPDTITAYSLEDNELWRRHLIQLFLKSLWASSIFFRSWKGTPLNILTMLMFVPGLIKYGEKTWFLRSGSNDHLRDSIIRHRDRGHTDPTVVPFVSTPTGNPPTGNTPTSSRPPSSTLTTLTGCPWSSPIPQGPLDRGPSCECATFMAGCNGLCCTAVMAEFDGVSYAEGCCVSCQPESEKPEVMNIPWPGPEVSDYSIPSPGPEVLPGPEVINDYIPSPDPSKEIILVAPPLQKAIEFFPRFKRLFTDVVLEPTDLVQSKSFFKNIPWTEAFEVIEIELGFMYDIFYTKPMVAYDEWGLVRRFICLFSEISTFMVFLTIDKHEYSNIDVIITWLLLVGATVEEIYSIILLCSSDWTMNWLSKQDKTQVTVLICEAISSCRLPFLFPANKRWSDSMAQYSLISYSLKKLPIKFFCISQMLEELSEVWNFFCICPKLECSSKNSNVVPKYLKTLIFEQLQEKSRHAPGIKEAKELCARRGDWTLEKMNCSSRLGWSTGGDFDKSILLWHLATDLCYYTDLNKKSSPAENSNRKASKLLSDCMVYLLVKHPVMLPDGIGQIRFQDSCSEATEIFQCVKDRIQACKRLFLQPPLKVKGDRSKSVLSDACRLAESLQSLEKEEEWNCEKKWEMMSRVWVEMLCYAACHCPQNRHAEELKNGGELLTHVWLLMAHFGITEHVYLD